MPKQQVTPAMFPICSLIASRAYLTSPSVWEEGWLYVLDRGMCGQGTLFTFAVKPIGLVHYAFDLCFGNVPKGGKKRNQLVFSPNA